MNEAEKKKEIRKLTKLKNYYYGEIKRMRSSKNRSEWYYSLVIAEFNHISSELDKLKGER